MLTNILQNKKWQSPQTHQARKSPQTNEDYLSSESIRAILSFIHNQSIFEISPQDFTTGSIKPIPNYENW